MTKTQRHLVELYAPIALKEFGRKHNCQKRVVGARGQWRLVYCRDCNRSAMTAAKKIAATSTRSASK